MITDTNTKCETQAQRQQHGARLSVPRKLRIFRHLDAQLLENPQHHCRFQR